MRPVEWLMNKQADTVEDILRSNTIGDDSLSSQILEKFIANGTPPSDSVYDLVYGQQSTNSIYDSILRPQQSFEDNLINMVNSAKSHRQSRFAPTPLYSPGYEGLSVRPEETNPLSRWSSPYPLLPKLKTNGLPPFTSKDINDINLVGVI